MRQGKGRDNPRTKVPKVITARPFLEVCRTTAHPPKISSFGPILPYLQRFLSPVAALTLSKIKLSSR